MLSADALALCKELVVGSVGTVGVVVANSEVTVLLSLSFVTVVLKIKASPAFCLAKIAFMSADEILAPDNRMLPLLRWRMLVSFTGLNEKKVNDKAEAVRSTILVFIIVFRLNDLCFLIILNIEGAKLFLNKAS